MILFAALALSIAAPAAAPQPGKCPDLVTTEALACRALEAQASGDPQGAAQAFEEAAKATLDTDLKLPRLWVAAGNMWLAAKQPGKAALDLDKGLAMKGLESEQRGEALLDRARAAEAQDDLKTARAKLTEAQAMISADPFYWYFSAALAIRENDAATAQASIGRALALAPNDSTILFEAGHVADFLGDTAKARSYWMRAAGSDDGEIGKAAAKAVEMLGVTPVVKMESNPPK